MSSTDKTASDGLHVVVATHGHCFDGMCSALMFTRLMRHVHAGKALRFTYRSSGYGPGSNGVDPALLVGDVNAILDFRFSVSPKLTWYFDHHVSAFPTPEDRTSFEARMVAEADAARGAHRTFHDGTYSSCTKLIADVGAREFDLSPEPTKDLVRWADMIDSAAFPSARMAVERADPVLQLMTVVEHMGDDAFLARLVPRLEHESLETIARSEEVISAYGPLRQSHESFIELVKARAVTLGPSKGGTVLVDMTDQFIDVAGKFVTYALYPDAAYSVIVTRSKSKCKISIGFNPWCDVPRRHNIAAICERFGGGGHPVVGAISTPADQVDRAVAIAKEVAAELTA